MQKIHPQYFETVDVHCLCGASYTLAATTPNPIKLENCPACHPTYNKWKVIVKESKWMRQKYEERMAKFQTISK